MKTTKTTAEVFPELPSWDRLSKRQQEYLQEKIDNFPAPIAAHLVWDLLKQGLEDMSKEEEFLSNRLKLKR